MPKHIKVSKHADTKKFYVSDVCEFLSVEVSFVIFLFLCKLQSISFCRN